MPLQLNCQNSPLRISQDEKDIMVPNLYSNSIYIHIGRLSPMDVAEEYGIDSVSPTDFYYCQESFYSTLNRFFH